MKRYIEGGNVTMNRDNVHRITLNGDLSMVGVKEQLPLLFQHVDRLAKTVEIDLDQQPPQEIDLTGVQALDACGCQLLTAFLRTLRQRGTGVFSLKLNEISRGKIHRLGFDDVLSAREFV
jgi:ABC-type transporter Mla MlaB component